MAYSPVEIVYYKLRIYERQGKNMKMERTNYSSGAPLEEKVGYSRMVKIGPYIKIGGTTSVQPDGTVYGERRRDDGEKGKKKAFHSGWSLKEEQYGRKAFVVGNAFRFGKVGARGARVVAR